MATSTLDPTHETLREYASITGGAQRVDRERGILRDIKIVGLTSKNGRTYKPAALRDAVNLYEGSSVYVDHDRAGGPRSYRDKIGRIRGVRYVEGDGLRGDLHVNKAHPVAPQLLEDAAVSPDSCGLSHDIEARTTRGRDGGVIVEAVMKVTSCDLVSSPATTSGLWESTDTRSAASAPTKPAHQTPLKSLQELDAEKANWSPETWAHYRKSGGTRFVGERSGAGSHGTLSRYLDGGEDNGSEELLGRLREGELKPSDTLSRILAAGAEPVSHSPAPTGSNPLLRFLEG